MGEPAPRRQRVAETVAISALLVWVAIQGAHFAWTKSSTYDEPEHVTAGYYALAAGDFSIDPQHPPLARMWCALPLLALAPLRLPTDWPGYSETPSLFWGPIVFWKANRNGVLLTGITRMPMVALTVLMGLLVYRWSRRLYGPRSALLALYLFAFTPSLLSHGALATTDLPIACTAALTAYMWWRWRRHPGICRCLASGLALGVALACKISGLFLLPALGLLVLAWCFVRPDGEAQPVAGYWRAVGAAVAALAALALALLCIPLGVVVCLAAGGVCACGPSLRRGILARPVAALATGATTLLLGGLATWALYKGEARADTVIPLESLSFSWPERAYVVAVGFASVWIVLRHTKLPRLLAALPWGNLGLWMARSAAAVFVAGAVLWASYGFSCRPQADGEMLPWHGLLRMKGALARVSAAALSYSDDVRLPLRPYWHGLYLVEQLHGGTGHGCRLVALPRPWPRRFYCPLVLVTKTPLPVLVLLALSLGMAILARHRPAQAELPLILPALTYLFFLSGSGMTVGERHMLPLYGFGLVWVSRVARGPRPSRVCGWLVAGLLVCQAASVLRVGPHLLAYTNTLAGVPAKAADWFRDTNVDWGQDLPLLARHLQQHPTAQTVGLAYFGTADPRAYGVQAHPIPLDRRWPGPVAVSVTLLDEDDPAQAWLHRRPILERIGGSIRVYGQAPRMDTP